MKNITTKSDCLESKENLWLNRKYNFDDLGQALMALFVLSSKDGWVNIMYTGLDAVGVDMQVRGSRAGLLSRWEMRVVGTSWIISGLAGVVDFHMPVYEYGGGLMK